MKQTIECDVICIGGGISGMTSAIYTSRANLKTIILEEEVCGGLVNTTYQIENFPSYNFIGGMELMEKVKEQVEELGVEINECIEILNIKLTDNEKIIETNEYIYKPKAVIIASGRKPKKLFNEDYTNVHYCATCDGNFYKNKNVIVFGGGNSAIEESLYLLSLGINHISIYEEQNRLFANQKAIQKLNSYKNTHIFTEFKVIKHKVKSENNKLTQIVVDKIDNDYSFVLNDFDGIFVFLGQEPNTKLFENIINMNNGYILADENMHTNIPGVFVAGDCRQKKYRQITTACADGTIAALEAENYIRSL